MPCACRVRRLPPLPCPALALMIVKADACPSCCLPQEPRLQGLVARRGVQPGQAHPRGREGLSPQPPRACPRCCPAPGPHPAHPHAPKDPRIRLPREMAKLPRHHHSVAKCGRHQLGFRRCAVLVGNLQNLQIQVGREQGRLRQDCRHDLPSTSQHWQLVCWGNEPGSWRDLENCVEGL